MFQDILRVDLPEWAMTYENQGLHLSDDQSRMDFTIELAKLNIEHETGGPFAATLFHIETGKLLAIGLNSVVRLQCSVLHAEMLAIIRGQLATNSYTLKQTGCALYSSCEPCAMCLGGILWSGVNRLVCGATKDAAMRIGFDEGPVFAESYTHLQNAGIEVALNVLADKAAKTIQSYRDRNGIIYNA